MTLPKLNKFRIKTPDSFVNKTYNNRRTDSFSFQVRYLQEYSRAVFSLHLAISTTYANFIIRKNYKHENKKKDDCS